MTAFIAMPEVPTRSLRNQRACSSTSFEDDDLGTDHSDDVSKAHRTVLQLANTDIRLPDKVGFDKVSGSCKFAATDTIVGDDAENPKAETLAPVLGKVSGCSGSLGQELLAKTFGNELPDTSSDDSSHTLSTSGDDAGESGVRLTGRTDVKLGSVLREQMKAAQDSCHDFGVRVMNFLGDGETQKPVKSPVLTSNLAALLLQAYGRCAEGIGNVTAMQGCEIGRLQETGSPDVRHMCHFLEPDDVPDDSSVFGL